MLREAARRVLPGEVIDRRKGYFPVPALTYLRGPYLELVRAALSDPAAKDRGLFRDDYVNRLLAAPEDDLTPLRGNKLWPAGSARAVAADPRHLIRPREPGRPEGDGRHTVAELIEKQSRRRAVATAGESTIPLDEATEPAVRAGGATLDDVLDQGDDFQVRGTANLHTGGTMHDVTALLHPELAAVAITASRALDIPVVGLDFIVPTSTETTTCPSRRTSAPASRTTNRSRQPSACSTCCSPARARRGSVELLSRPPAAIVAGIPRGAHDSEAAADRHALRAGSPPTPAALPEHLGADR